MYDIRRLLPTTLAFLSAAYHVSAHGFVTEITVDGVLYKGNLPVPDGVEAVPSVIQQIQDVTPNYGVDNPALTCGPGAIPAQLEAQANPGSSLTVTWQTNDLQHWPHNTGPIMTYMAECVGGTCDKFDDTQAKWFKIAELGYKDGSTDWYQNDLYNGQPTPVKLPDNIRPGNYLLRNEVIALHLQDTAGPEFYPACIQLNVGGNQHGAPRAQDLVSIPGAYKSTDPGFTSNQYAGGEYDFPGPPIAILVDGNSPSNTTNGTNSDNSPAKLPVKLSSTPSLPEPTNARRSGPPPTVMSRRESGSVAFHGKNRRRRAGGRITRGL